MEDSCINLCFGLSFLLVEMNGIEKAIELFKVRSEVVRFFSNCSVHIMMIIQVSIVVEFALHSEIQAYSYIKDTDSRNLLMILQFQLNFLLKEFGVLDERNKIHNYVYYVMQTLNLTNKSWRIETKKCLNRREGR